VLTRFRRLDRSASQWAALVWRRYPWLVVGTGVYLGLRLWSFVGIVGHASSFTDTSEYENVERMSVFSLDFWTWYKPWGSALLWKVLPGSTSTSVPVAQEIISVAAWLFLAVVVFRTLERRAVKYGGFGLVLAFSLVPAIAVWDGALLSESLSVSLGALLVGTMLLVAQSPSWPRVAAVLVAAFLLASTRSSNGYLTPFLLIPLAVAVAWRARWAAVAVAVGSLAIAGYTQASVNVRQWQVSFGEIVAGRILHSPSATAYFIAHGMPYRPSLEQQLWNAEHRPPVTYYMERYETDPTLTWFWPWFNAHFRSVYARYLISHPSQAIVDPIRDLPSLVSASQSTHDLQGLPVGIYAAQGYRDTLPSWLSRVLYPSSWRLLLAWSVTVFVLLLGLVVNGIRRRVWLVPAIMLLSTLPHAAIIWDGSATSLGRHALLLAIYVRLGLILASLCVVDGFLEHGSRVRANTRTAT